MIYVKINPAATEIAVPIKKFSILVAGTQTNPTIPAVPGAVFKTFVRVTYPPPRAAPIIAP